MRAGIMVVAVAVSQTVLAGSAEAHSNSCSPAQEKANAKFAYTLNYDVNGTKAVVIIPPSVPRNLTSGGTMYDYTQGDIALLNSGAGPDMIQFGWVYGYTQPGPNNGFVPYFVPFMGQYVPGAGLAQEILQFRTDIHLPQGSSHTFELRRNETVGDPNYHRWYGFIDGVQRLLSIAGQDEHVGMAVSAGEAGYKCTGMDMEAAINLGFSNYAATLQYHKKSTNLWYPWVQQIDAGSDDHCFTAGRFNGITGTQHAYNNDGPGCPLS